MRLAGSGGAARRGRLDLDLDIAGPALLALQVVAAGGHGRPELLQDGQPLAWEQAPDQGGGTSRLAHARAGRVEVRYRARVPERPPSSSGPDAQEQMVALRPSRYCPPDRTGGVVAALLGGVPDAPWERAVAEAVRVRTAYVAGSSTVTDDALDTLLAGRGVCRDFAHLVVMLCRSLDLPARFVSVYASGLSPMDFHAVAEVAIDGSWRARRHRPGTPSLDGAHRHRA